jgi:hypothetical protein
LTPWWAALNPLPNATLNDAHAFSSCLLFDGRQAASTNFDKSSRYRISLR